MLPNTDIQQTRYAATKQLDKILAQLPKVSSPTVVHNEHAKIEPLFTIFHFNDVYNIQPDSKEPKAGAAYFSALLQRQKLKRDAFAPALLSTEFKGKNMVQPLNALGIDLACFGNHDLDYDLEHVMELIKMTNFPWLLSNIYDKRTNRRLAEGEEYKIIEIGGVKVGIFSLAEEEWIDTLYPQYREICEYIPFVEFGQVMVRKLRGELGCNFIVALTHMMKYNDIKLAKEVAGIDLVLGGHDHLIVNEIVGHTLVIKSGCDFRNFSIIEVRPPSSHAKMYTFDVQLKEVNHEKEQIVPDAALDQYIAGIYTEFKAKQEKVACFTEFDLDLQFQTIRREQSAYLEFIVSIYRHELGTECAFIGNGNFRMDSYIKAGPITYSTVYNVIEDTIQARLVPGQIIIAALENCVSMYPNMSGRYCTFSGMTFAWDSSKKPGSRVLRQTVRVQDQPVDFKRVYKVAMFSFMGSGGDGFGCFKSCEKVCQANNDRTNWQVLRDLFNLNHSLLDTYVAKYPGRFDIVDYDGGKCLKFHLQKPKNVTMISSSGKDYCE